MQPIRIVIVGGGFGGVYAFKELHRIFHGKTNIQITMVSERNHFLFTPLLHEVATGGINPDHIVQPIRQILGCCLHDFRLGSVIGIDLGKRIVNIAAGAAVSYDYLVLASGAETNFYGTPGAQEHTLTLKSLEEAIAIKNRCIGIMEQAAHIADRIIRKTMLRFVVVGGGPTGVELAAELHEFLNNTFPQYYPAEVIEDSSVILIQRPTELLPQFSKSLREKSLKVLKAKGVEVLLGVGVKQVDNRGVLLANGRHIASQTVIWVAGTQPVVPHLIGNVQLSAGGRVAINNMLQLPHYPNAFAIGDVAVAISDPLPALAQVAVRQARAVAYNIARDIRGESPLPFQYRHKGTLVSLGQWMAVGEIAQFTVWGHLTWWLWRTIYLSKLISSRKKIKVALDWTLHAFSARDISLYD